MARFIPPGLGWHQGTPDFRDFTPESPEVADQLANLSILDDEGSSLPHRVDLRSYFPDVYDQLTLNASPSLACLGLVEYFDRRAHGRMEHPSGLFLYKVTRKLLQRTGDSGADLRTTLKALTGFGVPPERYCPYDVANFDAEPDPFLYSFAADYRAIRYLRLDGRNSTGEDTLRTVKAFLAAGFPAVFGFPVPGSLTFDADIPYRPTFDAPHGGQAVVAVGYDDTHLSTSRGALLIRSSWGRGWGDEGYGWLPYAYVEEQLAVDFWTVIRADWLASDEFTKPNL